MDGVKSARRVFEFLEHFERVRRAISVAELAAHYHYPSSSVSAVMRTMVSLGYLSYNATKRTYLPTPRLPFLVGWIETHLYDGDGVRAIMRELSAATGETIILGAQNGVRAQYIDIIEATSPVRLHATAGSFRSLPHTAIGLVLLSRCEEAQLGPLVRRINNEEADASRHVELARVREAVEAVRRDGHALSIGGVVPGAGALAMLLPSRVGATPLAVGIASVAPVLMQNRERYVSALRAAIGRHLDPAPAEFAEGPTSR